MNLDKLDDFLYEKSIYAINNYFKYLRKGFDIINLSTKEIPKEKENLIIEYFGKENIKYQVISTSFVNEIFHIVETYLKSNLLKVGEYLIYPSIDKYPEQKKRLDEYNNTQNKIIGKVLLDLKKSIVKRKQERIDKLSKDIGKLLFSEEKEIITNSISCTQALFRVEKYLNWTVSDTAKEKFKLFIENRNEIIHYNNLNNLTFACSHSIYVLNSISLSKPEDFPKFSKVSTYLQNDIEKFNILIPEILYATELNKVFNNIKTGINSIKKTQ